MYAIDKPSADEQTDRPIDGNAYTPHLIGLDIDLDFDLTRIPMRMRIGPHSDAILVCQRLLPLHR